MFPQINDKSSTDDRLNEFVGQVSKELIGSFSVKEQSKFLKEIHTNISEYYQVKFHDAQKQLEKARIDLEEFSELR